MIELIAALAPIAGHLTLGTALTILSVVFGWWAPRYLFPALIVAAAVSTVTFFYAKGAHDDFVLQRQRENASVTKFVKKAKQVRTRADSDARKQRGKCVRDTYDRDQSAPKAVCH
jgi:hypothetical protein